MEFRVYFAMTMYENDMFLLCETSNAGPFKSIKTMLKSLHVLLGLSPVWNCYPKGFHKKGTTYRSLIAYGDIKDTICKE